MIRYYEHFKREHFNISLKNKKILCNTIWYRFVDVLCILVLIILMQMMKWWVLLLPTQCSYYSLDRLIWASLGVIWTQEIFCKKFIAEMKDWNIQGGINLWPPFPPPSWAGQSGLNWVRKSSTICNVRNN